MAILSAYAGLPPWKRQSKRKDAAAGFQWNAGITEGIGGRKKKPTGPYATGGWTVVSPEQRTMDPKGPEMIEIHLYNGRKSYVPIGDVEQFIGFHKLDAQYVPEEMAEYVNKAFEHDAGRGRYYEVGGQGHIAGIRYNPTYQVMEVTFGGNASSKADTVTFFRVPKELWGEFENHATSGAMSLGVDGTQRHLLGIRFWDLVRIRGQRTGARYQFTYTNGGIKTGEGASEYAEMAERQRAPQAQQAVDANREATITHTEQAPEAEKAEIEKQQQDLKLALSGTKYTPANLEMIKRTRDMLIDKYGTKHVAYREFNNAIDQGLGAIAQVRARYKLWSTGE